MEIKVIQKVDIPPIHHYTARREEIRELFKRLLILETGQSLQVTFNTPKEASTFGARLHYYRNRRGRHTPAEYPDLRIAIRGRFLFCWRDEEGTKLLKDVSEVTGIWDLTGGENPVEHVRRMREG